MYISKNFEGSFKIKEHGVLTQNSGGLIDEILDDSLLKFDWLSPLSVLDLDKLLDDHINSVFFLCISLWLNEIFVSLELVFDLLELIL